MINFKKIVKITIISVPILAAALLVFYYPSIKSKYREYNKIRECLNACDIVGKVECKDEWEKGNECWFGCSSGCYSDVQWYDKEEDCIKADSNGYVYCVYNLKDYR
jgi:hypothetical protein